LGYAEHFERPLIDAGGTLYRNQKMKTPLAPILISLFQVA
jgi:hypothetical protein